jgi:hypothetical protein
MGYFSKSHFHTAEKVSYHTFAQGKQQKPGSQSSWVSHALHGVHWHPPPTRKGASVPQFVFQIFTGMKIRNQQTPA